MKRRSLILLLGGASGGGALAIGSGAFSSGAAERGVNVGVVPDDQAYVGYEIQGDGDSDPPEIVVTAGEYEELVRVKNRFPEGTEIEIVEASAPELNIRHDKHSFGPGETAGIDGTCNGEGNHYCGTHGDCRHRRGAGNHVRRRRDRTRLHDRGRPPNTRRTPRGRTARPPPDCRSADLLASRRRAAWGAAGSGERARRAARKQVIAGLPDRQHQSSSPGLYAPERCSMYSYGSRHSSSTISSSFVTTRVCTGVSSSSNV